jgi:hypothetical protein
MLSFVGGVALVPPPNAQAGGGEAGGEMCGRVLGRKRAVVTTLTELQGEIMVQVHDTGTYHVLLRVRQDQNDAVLAVVDVRGVRVIPAFLCLAPTLVIVVSRSLARSLSPSLPPCLSITSGHRQQGMGHMHEAYYLCPEAYCPYLNAYYLLALRRIACV